MESLRFPKTYKVIVPLAVLVVILTLIIPRKGEFKYSYSKGSTWKYETLVAPFSFPILKTNEQLTSERLSQEAPYVMYFKYSEDVYPSIAAALTSSHSYYNSFISSYLKQCYKRGVLPDSYQSLCPADKKMDDILYVQRGKKAEMAPVNEVYTVSQVVSGVEDYMHHCFPAANVDSLLEKKNIRSLVKANLSFDLQTSELVHGESVYEISPTMGTFQAGDVIISGGEIVTADIEQILDSFKAEYLSNLGNQGPAYLMWLGHFGIALVLAFFVLCAVWFCRPSIFNSVNEFLFILNVFLIACIGTFLVVKISPEFILLLPYPVLALYYLAYVNRRLVLQLYIICLLPLLLFVQGGAAYFVIFLMGGIVSILTFSNFNKGWRQFVSAFFSFLAMAGTYFAVSLSGGSGLSSAYRDILQLAFSALFIVLTYPMNFLFEKIFNLVSLSRLMELSDTNNKLLRSLSTKAPGTFQHTLSVMNMCEAAARSIYADVALVRVGALYHDIGKTLNPQCFIENQAPGVNYHEGLSPMESASEIIRHVTEGEALAEKYNLPLAVREFILTHHGNSTTGYFYTKYLNDGGDPANEASFRYPGPAPRTKEHAILMLCDSLEAASRSLKDYSKDSVSTFVDKITNQKLSEGQFNEANITFGEIRTVSETMKDYIVQMHHSRIAYPKRNNNNTKYSK